MSLLTKEQQETLDTARAWVNRCKDSVFVHSQYYEDFQRLIAIIDDLQSRAPKQYTEQELREAFEREIDKESGYASPMHFHCDLDIWMQCARFLGALKAEP